MGSRTETQKQERLTSSSLLGLEIAACYGSDMTESALNHRFRPLRAEVIIIAEGRKRGLDMKDLKVGDDVLPKKQSDVDKKSTLPSFSSMIVSLSISEPPCYLSSSPSPPFFLSSAPFMSATSHTPANPLFLTRHLQVLRIHPGRHSVSVPRHQD